MTTALKALIRKELIQTLRDKKLRVVLFALPVVQLIIFGTAISTDVKKTKVTLCDEDRSKASREIHSILTAGEYFEITDINEDCRKSENLLYVNKAKILLVIPAGFEKKLQMGENSPLQAVLDGSDGSSASTSLGYMLRMFMEHQWKTWQKTPDIRLYSITPPPLPKPELQTRVYFNPEMESRFFLLPGIMTMILTIIVTLLTAMGITREKESGTFDQLIVSPIRGWELILGKTLPYLLIGLVDLLLVTLVSRYVFQLKMSGSFAAFIILNTVYIICMLGLGLFISTVSSSQGQAMMTVFGFLFPFIILSDFFFPVDNMPIFVRRLTMLNPMKYALVAQREIFLKGNGLAFLWDSVLILCLFSVIFLGYGAYRFRAGTE
jgi:ABC-2 type transport system permease protein